MAVSAVLVVTTETGTALVTNAVVQLRLVAPGVFGDGEYAFSETAGSQPVAFGSCNLPLHVVINDARRPEGAEGLVEQAVDTVSEASGFPMIVDGTTDETPDPDRALEQERYGPGAAPILIAWTGPDRIPQLAGDTLGRGGPRGIHDAATGRPYYTTGHVFLDAAELGEELRKGHDDTVRATIMHELGHVLGLDHVDSPFELMSESNLGVTRFGPGDREGFARLARAACWR